MVEKLDKPSTCTPEEKARPPLPLRTLVCQCLHKPSKNRVRIQALNSMAKLRNSGLFSIFRLQVFILSLIEKLHHQELATSRCMLSVKPVFTEGLCAQFTNADVRKSKNYKPHNNFNLSKHVFCTISHGSDLKRSLQRIKHIVISTTTYTWETPSHVRLENCLQG
jgi:hypothetical protein